MDELAVAREALDRFTATYGRTRRRSTSRSSARAFAACVSVADDLQRCPVRRRLALSGCCCRPAARSGSASTSRGSGAASRSPTRSATTCCMPVRSEACSAGRATCGPTRIPRAPARARGQPLRRRAADARAAGRRRGRPPRPRPVRPGAVFGCPTWPWASGWSTSASGGATGRPRPEVAGMASVSSVAAPPALDHHHDQTEYRTIRNRSVRQGGVRSTSRLAPMYPRTLTPPCGGPQVCIAVSSRSFPASPTCGGRPAAAPTSRRRWSRCSAALSRRSATGRGATRSPRRTWRGHRPRPKRARRRPRSARRVPDPPPETGEERWLTEQTTLVTLEQETLVQGLILDITSGSGGESA